MISFSHLGEYGRLGNQLFQYAILKSVQNKTGFEIVLPKDINVRNWHGQQCLMGNFKLPSCTYGNLDIKNYFHEKQLRIFDTDVFDVKDNTDFMGFFQHPNYYTPIRDLLIKEFEMINSIQDKVDEYLHNLGTTVSLHVRRGDVSDGTNPTDTQWSNDFSEGSVLYNYYTNALKEIPTDSTILLFTGGSRKNVLESDIDWCKRHFEDERIVFVEGFNDIETFSLMKSCDYNITSFASTFSWWASFLNKKNNVIAPKNFYPSMVLDASNVYPENWKLL